ncbi:MAG: sugar phosphate isomerase/epimerase [Acidobacteriota bacterium]|nr:sugar phosphate isomerase/epimerase [Acidobacteriota bacterium]
MFTRREFGKIAVSAAAAAPLFGAYINSKVDGVQLGAQSYSFRDLPLDGAIQAMVTDGIGVCELFGPHAEAPGIGNRAGNPGMRPPGGPRGGPVDPAVAAARKKTRDDLREWRTSVPLSHFTDIRKKFDDAGVKLIAFNYSFNNSFSDEEIDRGFEFAKALGVDTITASTTLSVAKKVVPFAEKHKMIVAMHGHSDVKDPEQFATPESFESAMAMSKYYRINLDIGHFTAANYDPVDYLKKNHEKIVVLHLKDRKKDQGPNMVWGEGDTPIKAVLQLLKNEKYPIPALVEYEYKGTGTSVEEVKKCMDYAKRALQA